MKNFKLGVLLESFRLPAEQAIKTASELGVDGVQIFAANGEFDPQNLTIERKNQLISMLNDSNLEVSALCGDFGKGFGNRENNPKLIERSKRVMELALEFGTNIVTTHIGVVPVDKEHIRYKIMQEACHELAEYADSLNAHFAVETGPETATTLVDFLNELNSKGVAVNLDPANLAMVTGDDPVKAVETLKKYVVHTHAKDGVKYKECNPEVIYQITHAAPDERENYIDCFREMPLGQGSVKWVPYLNALKNIGYNGYLTIEREVGENPIRDIKIAAEFLTNLQ